MTTWLKGLLALAIVAAVGWQFARDLQHPDIRKFEFHWPWLALSAGIYLLGISFSALFWFRLLRIFGAKPTPLVVLRACYVGQLGKYVPGKAWALLLRSGLAQPSVPFGAAMLTAFCEVLTTMAAGALIAAIAFAIEPPETEHLHWHPLYTLLLLLGLVGLPLLPGVFNFLTARLAKRFPLIETFQTPRMSLRVLAEGLAMTGIGWALLGISLWAALAAVVPDAPPLTWRVWLKLVGVMGLSYVAGFLVLVVPGGIGVREYFLRGLLTFAGPEPLIVVTALLMRLAWTSAEVAAAAMFQLIYFATRRGDEAD